MRTLLVTGAGGFIGGHVIRRLARQGDSRVLAATRDGRPVAPDTTPLRLDVTDATGLEPALRGVDGIVHCAVGDRRTTVEGTQTLLAAARRAGVRRLVHLSSVAVYAGQHGPLTESSPLVGPQTRGYPGWKAQAERSCRAAAASGELEVVMLRPAIVYGSGSELWVRVPARRILSGRWGRLGPAGEGTCCLVHAADLAEAAAAALDAPAAAGEAFNIAGPDTPTWNAWFERLAAALGRPELPALPPARLQVRAWAALPVKALVRLVPPARPWFDDWLITALGRAQLAVYARAVTYPADKARTLLGWQARVRLEDGVWESISWLRQAEPRFGADQT